MRLTREVALAVPTERVWQALWDVPRMVACVPGCVEAREVEPRRRYQARMSQKVGPIALSVPLDIHVTEEAPGRLLLEARVRDAIGG
jgi:carbon monoxide dehydrogenase subunit G